MSFGERLRILREEKNLTQEKLGDILNVSDATINRYEKNLREPHRKMEEKIADFFDVSLDWLRGRKDLRKYPDDLAAREIGENPEKNMQILNEALKYALKKVTKKGG